MSEFGGLWKHALVPLKTECGCPSGGGMKNGHMRYPSYGGTQKKTRKKPDIKFEILLFLWNLPFTGSSIITRSSVKCIDMIPPQFTAVKQAIKQKQLQTDEATVKFNSIFCFFRELRTVSQLCWMAW